MISLKLKLGPYGPKFNLVKVELRTKENGRAGFDFLDVPLNFIWFECGLINSNKMVLLECGLCLYRFLIRCSVWSCLSRS